MDGWEWGRAMRAKCIEIISNDDAVVHLDNGPIMQAKAVETTTQ